MDLPRRELARFAAPAAFLLAVTVAALLVRAGFEAGSTDTGGPTTALTTTRQAAATTTVSTSTTTTQPAKVFYTIQSGDTLDVVAARYGKSVDDLLALNPGVDPHALRVGQKIRVG
ncbi:MAG TPA: LysM domain-containing protein [Gaiellaceae bacterium]